MAKTTTDDKRKSKHDLFSAYGENADANTQEYNGETFGSKYLREYNINKAMSEKGASGLNSSITNMIKGIRMFGGGITYSEAADDLIGLCFVSRPLLNLCNGNLYQSSKLMTMIDSNAQSMRGLVRAILDRSWAERNADKLSYIFNNRSPWINLITNTLKTSSGFKDLDIEIASTSPGFRKEVYQYVDGFIEENGQYTMSQNYFNVKNNILPYLFEIWLEYISQVSTNPMMIPNEKALIQRWIDYDCRIYHLIMNRDMTHVEQIHMTLQSIPVTYPTGTFSDINNTDTKRANGQDEFNMNFSSVGYRFNTWDCVDAFNYCTYYFNSKLLPNHRSDYYVKLKRSELLHFQYDACPLINKETMEMEWYIEKETYSLYESYKTLEEE